MKGQEAKGKAVPKRRAGGAKKGKGVTQQVVLTFPEKQTACLAHLSPTKCCNPFVARSVPAPLCSSYR